VTGGTDDTPGPVPGPPEAHDRGGGAGLPESLDHVEGSGPPVRGGIAGGIDASRVRSFIGLSIGLVGPQANLAVSGVLITLFVQQRASGALAVTFALTADRLVSWLTFPVVGRLSDRSRSRVGRRTPYMAASLMIMGVSTWMFTVVRGYWLLVLLILIAGQASAVFTLTNVAVVPEVFGRSRWIKALLLTTVLGEVASLTIKGTVIASWKQSDPATWNLPFQVAAAIMVGVGIAILVLVREAPTATYGAEADRKQRARPTRDELRDIMSGPNAKVLVAGSLLFWSGVGSTAYVAILFFERVLHAGASAQTIAGLATSVPVFIIGIGLGVPLSRWLTPMQLAIGAPLAGAVLAGVQYFDTHLWQAVVLSYIGAPLVGAYLIVMAPLLLQLLPRAGGLGERIGVLLAPFNLCSVVLAYIAAIVIDATGNYRLIWLFPAATGLAHATVNCWLKYPKRNESSPDMVKRLWEWSVVQAEFMAESGIVAGLLAAPLLGVVTKEDADSAVVIDMARNILGNPYEVRSPEGDRPALGDGGEGGDENDGALGESDGHPGLDQSGSDGSDGSDGVTGVRHVGGGPLEDLDTGDQKSERGDSPVLGGSHGFTGSEGSPSPGSAEAGPTGVDPAVDPSRPEPDGLDAAGLETAGDSGDSQSNSPGPVAEPGDPASS
jgi:Na+/melibiose symporter-like transporter